MDTIYTVSVGNIGVVIETPSYSEAKATYNEWVELSEAQYGRVAGEWVTLWEDGEPLEEYYGTHNEDEY